MKRIVIAGDWHGSTNHATWVVQRARREEIDTVFQVGDFGLWEHERDGVDYLDKLEKLATREGVTIYCLGGNHDNEKLAIRLHGANFNDEGFVLLRDHVRLAPRGHRWTWGGRTFAALGGAYSVDKRWRVERENELTWASKIKADRYGGTARDHSETLWFPDEETTDANVETVVAGGPVDVLLTHDKPRASNPGWNRKDLPECWPNQDRIQRAVDALQPLLVVHGHLHHFYHETLRGSRNDYRTTVVGLTADVDAMEDEPGYRRNDSVATLEFDQESLALRLDFGDLQLAP